MKKPSSRREKTFKNSPPSYSHPQETGFYYLQSRYYDPNLCRFINADDQFDKGAGIGAYNLFSYCANNPVIYKDTYGSSITLACIIIGAVVGFAVGGYYGSCLASGAGYSSSDGWDYWKYVVGYGAAGATIGALCGWEVSWFFAVSPVALGTTSYAGLVIYSSWQAAEQALRASIDSVCSVAERTLNTPMGARVVDAYNKAKGLIAEAKYGYQGLSSFIRTEIDRDAWLLQNGIVERVEWHFYYSPGSQSGGASIELIGALVEAGIHVVFHFNQ